MRVRWPKSTRWRLGLLYATTLGPLLLTIINPNFAQAPSTDTFAAVPLGSSSASMYPGYSPKDHEYGKASMEAGQAFAEAKKRGLELPQDPKAPSFVVGQAHGAKRRMMFQDKGDQKDGQQQNGTEGAPKADAADDGEEEATSAAAEDGNPYFVIDTDPTPVDIPKDKTSKKRSSADRSPREPPTKKSKKAKTETSQEGQEPKVEFEDISAEVDERLKAKEAKRKAREEKKRRRESGESAVAESTEATVGTEKPKKKAKKENGGKESKKRSKSVDTDEPAAEEESFKKKHKKEKIATGAE